jgi:hypothetical protein
MILKKLIILLSASLLVFSGACKKTNTAATEKITAKIVCGDCTWVLQNGSKALVNNKPKGKYNESLEISAKKGDTILFFGYNYSTTENMDGYLLKGTTELKHGVTHCGGNPTFFMEYIIP